jgi:hypothetical protein
MQRQADPVVVRWLGVLLLWLLALACARPVPPLRPVHLATGAHLPRLGCIDAATATERDFRSIPGVGTRLARDLLQHCRAAPCTPRHLPVGVRGVGPVLTVRLGALLCERRPSG